MKKTIKSLLCLLLVLCMALSTAACGEESGQAEKSKEVKGSDQATGNEKEPASDGENSAADTPIEEIIPVDKVIVDNSECMVKITKLTICDTYDCEMEVEYENRTSSLLSCDPVDVSVNGITRDTGTITMNANEAGTQSIRLGGSKLRENEVGAYTDIALTLWIYYMNLGSSPIDIARESLHLYPYGEEKATRFVREPKDTDQVIVDNEYVTVLVTDYDRSDDRWFGVDMYILNKTDTTIKIRFDDVAINGIEANIGGGSLVTKRDVEAGLCYFADLSWKLSKLEEKGITAIEEISATLRVVDDDPYTEEDLAYETITLNP